MVCALSSRRAAEGRERILTNVSRYDYGLLLRRRDVEGNRLRSFFESAVAKPARPPDLAIHENPAVRPRTSTEWIWLTIFHFSQN